VIFLNSRKFHAREIYMVYSIHFVNMRCLPAGYHFMVAILC